jgi:ADP-ribosylglycohydrolase/protein-tyrosine phosphatase
MPAISPDRARGALLGLALGDAYGRSLEFVRGPRVRTQPVPMPSRAFMWTDDTHMALYLVDALADVGRAGLRRPSEDDLGRAIGAAFVRWSRDPLTPSTAPGNTCLSGAAAFARSGDWRSSGVRASDGCGAVMRIAPLPVVLSGAALVTAARVQALVTHAHDNAPATAIAACLLLRELLEGAALGGDAIARTQARLRALGAGTPTVHAALDAAVSQAARPRLDWLDEADIPDGDGGWRSPSALGLALVAALRWADDPALAMEKAARIDGDSDSVACLTGMFLGAVHGVGGLPAGWLAALPQRDRIDAAVDTLLGLVADAAPAPAPAPRGARTSETDPIQVAWVAEDVGGRGGRLGVTLAPGKQARSSFGPPWHRDLAVDLDRLAEGHGVDVLVSLVEDAELGHLHIPHLVAEAEARGIAVLRLPVRDCDVPGDPARAAQVAQAALSLARAGRRVVFHCRGGLGRAGTLAACTLRAAGLPADAAMARVRAVRPGAIETPGQERFVAAFHPQPTTPG